jgi:molybdopterin-biosynthesis enzyme MoeA-like protein
MRRWVPVVKVNGNVCIFPGVPSLFERLVTAFLSRWVPLPPSTEKPTRVLIHTELPESSIAPSLTTLQERVKKESIVSCPEGVDWSTRADARSHTQRVGSYPKLLAGVDVSLIGKDASRLEELAQEVVKELQGEIILQGKLGEESK